MDWNFRRLVRVFLVIGGAAYIVWGLMAGDVTTTVLGGVAVLLGLLGLLRERQASNPNSTS